MVNNILFIFSGCSTIRCWTFVFFFWSVLGYCSSGVSISWYMFFISFRFIMIKSCWKLFRLIFVWVGIKHPKMIYSFLWNFPFKIISGHCINGKMKIRFSDDYNDCVCVCVCVCLRVSHLLLMLSVKVDQGLPCVRHYIPRSGGKPL